MKILPLALTAALASVSSLSLAAEDNKTQPNKDVLIQAFDALFVNFDTATARGLLAADYIQHNPQVPNGIDGLTAALKHMAQAGIEMSYDKLHLSVAEGNSVFTAAEGSFADTHTAFFDLFRVEQGKIIEHWHVMSDIPRKARTKTVSSEAERTT